ncbi:hypothetical protein AALP_AA4G155000 [Arabis alpina]|uniref:DC1 domain-containing protein n=1 Tax=Arabis alpina TaxID=50452 RepID=A0A087H3H2_ARAAL|nr:hypothetical protein AALP_AA4G155000 [Arabis alpina]
MSWTMPIQHFSHVHPLTKVEGYGDFICDGCKTYGFGTTYRCVSCDYDLHYHCATCPPTLISFMHPQHELRRIFREPDQGLQNRRMCDICDETVEGLYYHCEPCGFDVHPLCTQLPQHRNYLPHPAHHLELSHSGASNICKVCRGTIQSWRYKCSQCRLDVHMECVTSSERGETQQERGATQQPQFHHSQFYNHEYTNQGQVQNLNPSKGRKMYTLLVNLSSPVVCSMIFGPFGSVFSGPLAKFLNR